MKKRTPHPSKTACIVHNAGPVWKRKIVTICRGETMSALMASFERVKIQDYEYLLFVVFWNDFENPLTTYLRNNAISFGEAIEERGFVVVPFEKKSGNYPVDKSNHMM
jgi:hypothetical protein